MTVEVPEVWVIVLNTVGLPALQLGLAWAFSRLPETWFCGNDLRPGDGGRAYERLLAIKAWKDLVPDGAAWFRSGFSKASLHQRDASYLRRFAGETRRGELCHWAFLAVVPVFFLWNPWWADAFIAIYALGANLPCILIQRYNRARLARVLSRRATGGRS